MPPRTHQELWAECCAYIRDVIEPIQYDTWFRDITSVKFENGVLELLVKSGYFADQLEERFVKVLKSGINKVYGPGVQLYYVYNTVKNDNSSAVTLKSAAPSPVIMAQSTAQPANPFTAKDNKPIESHLNPRYTFENYCLSNSNKIAGSIGESIADNPSVKTFNPLFVFGPTGVGKTHLIQAIGIRLKEHNPESRVLYVTARLFESQFTAARAKGEINSFFHFYQRIDTLIIDDVQDLRNKPATQNTFFHIFNHLHQNNKQIIMSSDCAPSEMEGLEARLLSRFKWGMSVALDKPDIELRRDVLRLKAEQDGLSLSDEVLEFIAANVTDSIRELEGIVVSLLAHATVLNREITVDLARVVLANAVKMPRRQVNFEMIAQAVASHYGIDADLLFTKTRRREISDPRQVLMYLAKKIGKMSTTTIGNRLSRTHATVIYGCREIEERLSVEKKLMQDIQAIE
nr:chromosomal replication initiator protein DnaA [Muribaculaceae bacterium]